MHPARFILFKGLQLSSATFICETAASPFPLIQARTIARAQSVSLHPLYPWPLYLSPRCPRMFVPGFEKGIALSLLPFATADLGTRASLSPPRPAPGTPRNLPRREESSRRLVRGKNYIPRRPPRRGPPLPAPDGRPGRPLAGFRRGSSAELGLWAGLRARPLAACPAARLPPRSGFG